MYKQIFKKLVTPSKLYTSSISHTCSRHFNSNFSTRTVSVFSKMVSSPSEKRFKASEETSTNCSAQFQVKLLNEKAQIPKRGSPLAAGYDIFSSQDLTILKGGRAAVETGISIKVPSGTYGRVAPRSGLTFKFGIDTGAGVIDEDYTGEVKVILFNHGDSDFVISTGDRIAQLILEKIMTPAPIQVEELGATVRGAGGFGSTGTN